MWMPLDHVRPIDPTQGLGCCGPQPRNFMMFARLAPGVTIEAGDVPKCSVGQSYGGGRRGRGPRIGATSVARFGNRHFGDPVGLDADYNPEEQAEE